MLRARYGKPVWLTEFAEWGMPAPHAKVRDETARPAVSNAFLTLGRRADGGGRVMFSSCVCRWTRSWS